MRHWFFTVLFLAGCSVLSAQAQSERTAQSELTAPSAEDEVIRLKQTSLEESNSSMELTGAEDPSGQEYMESDKSIPGNWNMMVGTSFSYMKGYGSGMNLYAAPMYTLPLNNRWSLHGGVLASSFTGLNMNGPIENTGLGGSAVSLSAFAAASFRMNDRLVLHGAGVKQLISAPYSPLSPQVADNFSIGATYRLGNNVTIGASVHMTNGPYYYGSPASPSLLGSPMHSPFGW